MSLKDIKIQININPETLKKMEAETLQLQCKVLKINYEVNPDNLEEAKIAVDLGKLGIYNAENLVRAKEIGVGKLFFELAGKVLGVVVSAVELFNEGLKDFQAIPADLLPSFNCPACGELMKVPEDEDVIYLDKVYIYCPRCGTIKELEE